jgi:hypothetical protein
MTPSPIPPVWLFEGRTVVRATPHVGAPLINDDRMIVDQVKGRETAENCTVVLRDARRGRVRFELPLSAFLVHWKPEVDYVHYSSIGFVTSDAGSSSEDAPDGS